MTVSAAVFVSREVEESYPNIVTVIVDALVETDSASDGPFAVLAASGLPSIGDTYNIFGESNSTVFCTRKKPTQDDQNDLIWHVQLEYTNQVGTDVGGGGDVILNPLLRPVVLSYSAQSGKQLVTVDYFGQPLINVLGEPLGTVEIEDSRAVLRLGRNESSINAAAVQIYKDAVNADSFGGFPATTLRMRGISVDGPLFENDVTFFAHGYEMEYNPRGWRMPLLNAGLNAKDAADSDTVKSIDFSHLVPGVKLDRYPLTSTGHPVTSFSATALTYVKGGGEIVQSPYQNGPPFDGAQFYREESFSALGLI